MRVLYLLILLVFVSPVYASSDNIFESSTVGFKVTKPSSWSFMNLDEYQKNLGKVKTGDEDFQKKMVQYATAPLVGITKFPEPYDDLNPSLKVNIRPLGKFKGTNPTKIIHFMLPMIKKQFKDAIIVQEPMETKISGMNAAYAKINYTVELLADSRTFPTTSELWVVPRGNYFFMIGAGTRQDEKTGSRKEIKQILDTVLIERFE